MSSFGYYSEKEPTRFVSFLRNRRLPFIIAVFGVMILLFTFSNKGFLQRIRLESKKQYLIERVRALELENKRLQFEEEKLRSDLQTIEHVAREKHGMIKPGEIVYRVREKRK